MSDQLTANAIMSIFPNLVMSVPYFGEIDFSPLFAAAVVFAVLTFFFWLLRKVILERFETLASMTDGVYDDLIVASIRNIRTWVYSVVALYAALQFFTLPVFLEKITSGIFFFAVVWQVIEIITQSIDYFITRFIEKDEDGDGEVDKQAANASNLVALMSRIVLWALGLLFVLSNLGVEVTSLVAGLGIGGVAIAFALQGVLGDLFASFSLYFDKPFRVGDFIVIGDNSGHVEKIGIKSTRIRTQQGEELVVSNTELTTARVQNFKKMKERRVVAKFGITYETPQEKVRDVSNIVKNIFEGIEGSRLDRVHFTSFGDSALIFEVVYYINSPQHVDYLNIQQDFNFELLQRFTDSGIDFAYPTQTIYTKTAG